MERRGKESRKKWEVQGRKEKKKRKGRRRELKRNRGGRVEGQKKDVEEKEQMGDRGIEREDVQIKTMVGTKMINGMWKFVSLFKLYSFRLVTHFLCMHIWSLNSRACRCLMTWQESVLSSYHKGPGTELRSS